MDAIIFKCSDINMLFITGNTPFFVVAFFTDTDKRPIDGSKLQIYF